MKNKKSLAIGILIAIFAIAELFVIKDFLKEDSKVKGDIFGDVDAGISQIIPDVPPVYKNWSELSSIDNDYSYSTLFYTKNTKVYVNSSESNSVSGKANSYLGIAPVITLKESGSEAQIIITNCAVDKNGDLLDAVINIYATDIWKYSTKESQVSFSINGSYAVNKGQLHPVVVRNENTNSYQIEEYMPISFGLNTLTATANVRLTYYKDLKINKDNSKNYIFTESDAVPGTIEYATIDKSKSTIATNIDKVNTLYSDIDIPRSYTNTSGVDYATYKLFEGREGVAPLNGSSTIYYAKGGVAIDNAETNNYTTSADLENINDPQLRYVAPVHGKTSVVLQEANGGIYVKYNDVWRTFSMNNEASIDRTSQHNIDGLWYGHSAEVLTSGLNGEYDFVYSGSDNGMVFIFISPRGYDVVDPIKTVDKTTVSKDEEFVYKVQQYIPNNYFSNIVNFHEVYPNTYLESYYLTKFEFEDDIDERLTINQNGITVTDVDGNDLSAYFTVSVEGHKVKTSQTNNAVEFYNSPSTYNNYLILSIPVKYSNEVNEDIIIPNTGKTTLKIGDNAEVTKNTNRVTTVITPQVVKLTYDCMTNGGNEANYTINVKPGTNVDLSRLCTKKDNKFKGWAEHATDKDKMNSFIMPNVDTTIYGLYEPETCNVVLTSSVYKIDETNHTIDIPNEHTNEQIKSNVTSLGNITITETEITVQCDNKIQKYKINRYWVPKTGQNPITYIAIIIGLGLVIAGLILLKKKIDNK